MIEDNASDRKCRKALQQLADSVWTLGIPDAAVSLVPRSVRCRTAVIGKNSAVQEL